MRTSLLAAALALVAAVPVLPAAAEPMIMSPLSDYGKVNLADRQSAAARRYEMQIGRYNNEPIVGYGEESPFRRLGRPVGRLDVATDKGVAPCTAFVISQEHVLTNWHCVPGVVDLTEATQIIAVSLLLGYTREGVEEGTRRYTVNPVPVEADRDLDYAVLQVFQKPSAEFGVMRVAAKDPLPDLYPYWIVGHPMERAQHISREQCRSDRPAFSGGALRHTCDTLPGNSGSPVIDPELGAAVALHHAGSEYDSINFAIPLSRIAADSAIVAAAVEAAAEEAEEAEAGAVAAGDPVREWEQVKDSRSPAVFEAFIARHPGSLQALLARERLDALRDERDRAGTDVAVGTFPRAEPEPAASERYPDLSRFRDCPECPEMVVIPGGSFWMGSPEGEARRQSDEGPQHRREITKFALGRTEVTFDEWQACVDDGGCRSNPRPNDRGWGRGSRPVVNVSWNDAQEFVEWMNGKVEGEPYRLPSEAEWEYAVRANEAGGRDASPFHFGETISTDQANYNGNFTYGRGRKGEYRGRTVPVGDLPAAENRWGLRHMHGNVWEWTEDCWHGSYRDAPGNQRAWLEENGGDCSRRVVRGGSWYNFPQVLRSAYRSRVGPGSRYDIRGFRLARTLLTP